MSTPELMYIDHIQFLNDVRALARALRTDDRQPDFIVGIGRGNLTQQA